MNRRTWRMAALGSFVCPFYASFLCRIRLVSALCFCSTRTTDTITTCDRQVVKVSADQSTAAYIIYMKWEEGEKNSRRKIWPYPNADAGLAADFASPILWAGWLSLSMASQHQQTTNALRQQSFNSIDAIVSHKISEVCTHSIRSVKCIYLLLVSQRMLIPEFLFVYQIFKGHSIYRTIQMRYENMARGTWLQIM